MENTIYDPATERIENGMRVSDPYAFGPGIGAAYQIGSKTVLRAGWGISCGQTAPNSFWSMRFVSCVSFSAPPFGGPAMIPEEGVPVKPIWPNSDPGQYPINPAAPSNFVTCIDPQAGRPPRLNMWSIGVQRQIPTNPAVDVTCAGNRGVRWGAGIFREPNRPAPQILAKNGPDRRRNSILIRISAQPPAGQPSPGGGLFKSMELSL